LRHFSAAGTTATLPIIHCMNGAAGSACSGGIAAQPADTIAGSPAPADALHVFGATVVGPRFHRQLQAPPPAKNK
jgi:hypothetical protein